MKIKEIFITIFLTLIAGVLCAFEYMDKTSYATAQEVFEVYLNGDVIGYINDDDELYDIINQKQKEIKEKYNVDNVYPPETFQIVKTSSYNVKVSTAEEIYERLFNLDTFTVEGYTVTFTDSDNNETSINVLDKQIFEDALHDFILAFVDEEDYNNYMNNTQPEIETTGKTIELMYFDETISIKRGLISVNNKIYTDETDLSQYLLFGDGYEINTYTIAAGDTIASISDKNKLNAQEFLIANPKYNSEDSLLTIGDKVNITLINPVITLSIDIHEVSDTTIPYEKKIVYDNTKPSGYSEVTTAGITGVTRMTTLYEIKNGDIQDGVQILEQNVLVEKVDEVTTKKGSSSYAISGKYVDDGSTWAWPTNQPYMITSGYGWRSGSFHPAIDISGTGCGSPIYASLDGEVIWAGNGGTLSWEAGWNIIIKHDNGYYTVYAHMIKNSLTVQAGDRVTRGQIIGQMGATGRASGCHLHFGLWYGAPYQGGYYINPLSLWR